MQTSSDPTQATTTHSLIAQVQARRDELSRGLTATANGASTRADIEGALAAAKPAPTVKTEEVEHSAPGPAVLPPTATIPPG